MQAILSFDVEEFDVPLEFGRDISLVEQIEVSTKGMKNIEILLNKFNIPATIFCTAQYALKEPEFLKALSLKNEIASHGFYHSSFDAKVDLKNSKKVLSEITNQRITGFRMARMMPVENTEILAAGYEYNASLNPTYIPGRYNHLNKPKLPFFDKNLLQIPASVSPLIRFPLFWLSFKNLPLWIFKFISLRTLKSHKTINLYFHPWEFTDISNYEYIPKYIRKDSGNKLLDKLEKYILWLKSKNVNFITMDEYVKQFKDDK